MKYFTINELTKSSTAARLGINNAPGPVEKGNLTQLVEHVLDPLREAWGKPIRVSSGYRCPKLNKVVGGAITSQHTKGQAADITSLTDDWNENLKLLKLLLNSDIEFDQVICEYPDAQGRPNWIHVSYNKNGNRKKKTTCVKGHYINGINI